jgi:D-xylulose kinase
MDTLLGIDLGTTGIKAAICTPDGRLLGDSYLEYPLIRPAPGVVEQDAGLWWALAQDAIHQAIRGAQVPGDTVRSLSVSSQGISFVPVDKSGQTLARAINWLDTRATAEAARISQQYSDADLFELTGKRASPSYVLPKLLWLRKHEPDIYRRTHKFLMGHDYLVYKLTGEHVTDHSMAGGTLLYDIAELAWSRELADTFEIDIQQLPSVEWSGTPVGKIKPDVAQALGLKKDTVVAVGGQDQKCAALGANIRPGVATVSLGTASAISCLADQPLLDPERRIPTFPFVSRGFWDLEGVVGTAGGAFRWLKETLFPAADYDTLADLAAASAPGANGVFFFPHLSGAGSPHWQSDVWGAFGGLSLAVQAGDMVRSVLEGVAFQIRENLEVMESMEIAVEELVLFGGGAQSSLWSQMISDIAGKPASATGMVDVANWGACVLAGAAAGIFDEVMAQPTASALLGHWSPRRDTAARYDGIYLDYRAFEERLLHRA